MNTVIVHNNEAILGHGIWAATSLTDGMTQLHVQTQLFQCYTLEILAIPFLSPVSVRCSFDIIITYLQTM